MKFYQSETDILARAASIKLLVLDVDGILTTGQLYFGDSGEVIKAFNTLDGHGIKLLQANDIQVAIISGRKSAALSSRAAALGIRLIRQGREDKLNALQELRSEYSCPLPNIAMMGDDLPDLPVMLNCGLAITVPNAHVSIHQHAHLCTDLAGGEGAVREAADFLLKAQGRYEAIIATYLAAGGQS
jgi:3-deoxy-D-manno-octulosonate 8-phosphate phosphatase (KDO 8-P phosphatase)